MRVYFSSPLGEETKRRGYLKKNYPLIVFRLFIIHSLSLKGEGIISSSFFYDL